MTKIEIEFSEDEMNFLNAMAEYLSKRGLLQENNTEALIKYALFKVLGPMVLREIEERRKVE